ncbi:Acyl-CoA-binding domain-containing protein 3 [Cardamine amara subsp. amara]|uniref:Acyl-CoA-binding domain-containing protein 3 n=1 Tax=Cardamine amara subsp. amara TaxID=228776 RepID=A0ABD1BZI6_CARAN
MEFFLEMLLTAVVAFLFSFLVAKLVSAASGAGGDDHTSDQPEIGVGGDGFETEELRFGLKMDVGVIESERDYRVVDENVELVDRFESEGDRVDEVEEAATGNAEELVVLTAEAESTAAVSPDNVIAEEMIVSGHDERRDSAEQISASSSPENVVAEETLSQGIEKTSACVEKDESVESEEVKVEESNTVEESDSEEENEENEEKEELSIEEDDDWEGIERSELEKAFVAASNLLADESGKVEEISGDAKMELYGLHKIATEGPCREAQPLAIMASARAKWNAWQKLGNMNQEEAMEQYLELVSKEIPALINTVGKMPELETSVVLPPNSGTTLDTTGVDSSKMGKGESSV